jgi:hypothetical protein
VGRGLQPGLVPRLSARAGAAIEAAYPQRRRGDATDVQLLEVVEGVAEGDGLPGPADLHHVDVVVVVQALLLRAGRNVVVVLRRFFDENGDESRRREADRLPASLDAASATPAPTLFARSGRRAPLSAFIEGFSLHAATRVMASNRRGLWRLCAYGARGAVASSRLSELPDGRFAYDMKRALPDGRRQLVMTDVELVEKLVPLIPPTYANLTRFHGVFAPTSRLRARVVPRPPGETKTTVPSVTAAPPTTTEPPELPKSTSVRSTYRLDWAALLKGSSPSTSSNALAVEGRCGSSPASRSRPSPGRSGRHVSGVRHEGAWWAMTTASGRPNRLSAL